MFESQIWFALWLGAFAVSAYMQKIFNNWVGKFVALVGWFFFVCALGLLLQNAVNKAEASSMQPEDCHYFYTEKYAKMAGLCYDGLDDWKKEYAYPRRVMWAVPDARMIFNPEFAIPSMSIVECESLHTPFHTGNAGELGQWQIWPGNAKEMESLDLEFGDHRDMATYAVFLWNRSKWKDWNCKEVLE